MPIMCLTSSKCLPGCLCKCDILTLHWMLHLHLYSSFTKFDVLNNSYNSKKTKSKIQYVVIFVVQNRRIKKTNIQTVMMITTPKVFTALHTLWQDFTPMLSVNLHQHLLSRSTWAENLDHLQQLCNELQNGCSSQFLCSHQKLSVVSYIGKVIRVAVVNV